VLQDAVVHGVQVLHVEGGEGKRALELLREEVLPRVVAHEHQTFPYGEDKFIHAYTVYNNCVIV